MTLNRASSDIAWISADLRSRNFIRFPTAVLPLPSAAWHEAHFDLKVAAASAAATELVRTGRKGKATSKPATSEAVRILRCRIAEQSIFCCSFASRESPPDSAHVGRGLSGSEQASR